MSIFYVYLYKKSGEKFIHIYIYKYMFENRKQQINLHFLLICLFRNILVINYNKKEVKKYIWVNL